MICKKRVNSDNISKAILELNELPPEVSSSESRPASPRRTSLSRETEAIARHNPKPPAVDAGGRLLRRARRPPGQARAVRPRPTCRWPRTARGSPGSRSAPACQASLLRKTRDEWKHSTKRNEVLTDFEVK